MYPRFQGEAFYANSKLVEELDKLATAKELNTSQLALAWVAHLSPYVGFTLRNIKLIVEHPDPRLP